MTLRERLSPSAIWCFSLAFCMVFFCFTGAPVIGDPDTAWHLAAGDLWREKGFIEFDPWGWTNSGKPWVNLAWAYDIAISWLHQHTGWHVLYPLTIFWYSAILAIMCSVALLRGANTLGLILTLLLVVTIVYPVVLLRPNMMTLALIICSYLLLSSPSLLARKAICLLAPLLIAVWVNTHGGFILFYALLGSFWLEAIVQRNWREVLRLTGIGAVSSVGIAVNPYGPQVLETVWVVLSSPFNSFIKEWHPVNFRDNSRMLILLFLLLVGSGFTDTRIRLAERIWIFILFYLSLGSIRTTSILAVFIIPYLSTTTGWVIGMSEVGNRLLNVGKRWTEALQTKELQLMSYVMLAISMSVCSITPLRDALTHKPVDWPEAGLLQHDLHFIQKHYAGKKLLNHYDIGGYLIYHGRGNPKLFVDGRAQTAYPEQVLTDYVTFMRYAGQDFRAEEIQKKYGFEAIIFPNAMEDKTDWDNNTHWRLDYAGSAVSVYVRRGN